MFKETLFASSQRRFREVKHGEGDIQMQWLLTALRVEYACCKWLTIG
jgi:3-O-alpha-D-mannopyranosyl-alpha-D-mannopyranose xylosylphosphotransferase